MVSRSLKRYDLLTPRTVKQFKSWTPLSAAGQLCCHNLLTSCWFMLENDWRRVCVVDVWLIVFGCCWDNRWLSGVSSLFFPWCPRLTSIRFSSWSFSEPGSGVQSGGAANGQLRAGRTATHGHPASRWDEATLFLRSHHLWDLLYISFVSHSPAPAELSSSTPACRFLVILKTLTSWF